MSILLAANLEVGSSSGVSARLRRRAAVRPKIEAAGGAAGLVAARWMTRLLVLTAGVRAERGAPAALAGSVVAAIRDVDPALTSEVRTLAVQVGGTLRQERLTAMVAGLFGTLALLLTAAGLHGVTLLAMRRQRVAIGIRMALGATRGWVLRAAVRRACVLVGAGAAIGGGAASLAIGRSLGTLLYGPEPHDPATLVMAAGVLLLAGVGAGLAAAVPVVRVEPSRVLRQT